MGICCSFKVVDSGGVIVVYKCCKHAVCGYVGSVGVAVKYFCLQHCFHIAHVHAVATFQQYDGFCNGVIKKVFFGFGGIGKV